MDAPGPLWRLRGCPTCAGDVCWDELLEDYICMMCGRGTFALRPMAAPKQPQKRRAA